LAPERQEEEKTNKTATSERDGGAKTGKWADQRGGIPIFRPALMSRCKKFIGIGKPL
jgi:hypothetical protein